MARYIDTANALDQETKMGLRRFEVCDNVDLETILMEYESYYFVKFQKYPKIVRKAADTGTWLFSFSFFLLATPEAYGSSRVRDLKPLPQQ